MCRKKTVGVTRTKFSCSRDELQIELTDVGGQRSERGKWKKCFDGTHLVIYLVSLSDYDEVLYEANSENAMREALDCFGRTINGEWFQDKRFIVLFSKEDVLKKKISQSDELVNVFPEYKGGTDPKLAQEFITGLFFDQNKGDPSRLIPLVVTLTDTESVKMVDAKIMEIIRTLNL